jgi:hypothetical protein
VSQSSKLLEESEDVLSAQKKTAERIQAYSPLHERVTGVSKTSLAEKQKAGKPSSAGAGRRSTAGLYSRPTRSCSTCEV